MYCLVPFETDESKKIFPEAQPKYLEYFKENSPGFPAKRIGDGVFLRDYFIIKFDDKQDLSWIDKIPDIIKIEKESLIDKKDNLSLLGIDTKEISTSLEVTSVPDVEKKIMLWMLEKEKTIEDIFNGL